MRHLEDLLPLSKLDDLAIQSDAYRNARPFPHVVFDDFLQSDIVRSLICEFPQSTDPAWLRYKAPAEKDKLQSTSELSMPAPIREVINAFNSSTFVRFLERLTGIEGIVPDPHLYGGGMHQTLPGGFLKMHVDYNRHNKWKLDRRLNLLLYLNEPWKEEWGGALELWEGGPAGPEKVIRRVPPIANRVVIFSTTEISWHGHPDPLTCPEGTTRKSIALYYYSNGRPGEEKSAEHNTRFVERPGEEFKNLSVNDWIRDFVPPIILKTARKFKNATAR